MSCSELSVRISPEHLTNKTKKLLTQRSQWNCASTLLDKTDHRCECDCWQVHSMDTSGDKLSRLNPALVQSLLGFAPAGKERVDGGFLSAAKSLKKTWGSQMCVDSLQLQEFSLVFYTHSSTETISVNVQLGARLTWGQPSHILGLFYRRVNKFNGKVFILEDFWLKKSLYPFSTSSLWITV